MVHAILHLSVKEIFSRFFTKEFQVGLLFNLCLYCNYRVTDLSQLPDKLLRKTNLVVLYESTQHELLQFDSFEGPN